MPSLLDSASVFAALLDEHQGGRFSVHPVDDWDSAAAYLPGTNILETMFRTRHGIMKLTDFMPVYRDESRDSDHKPSDVYRCVEATRGEMTFETVFDPRFDYAREAASLEAKEEALVAKGVNDTLILSASHGRWAIQEDGAKAVWRLKQGERLWLRLHFGNGGVPPLREEQAEKALTETGHYWRNWLETNETGRDLDLGRLKPMIDRSALVLKLLEFSPTGAIAAAATTSLPEAIGGVRNWDYRFSWIRDSALTVEALYNVGHLTEMEAYLQWMESVLRRSGSAPQILYGLREDAQLIEEELNHLEGYKGSAPVRVGNGAYDQKQLDIYGEIMDAALRLSSYAGKIDNALWPFLRGICDTVVNEWQTRDSGIWEVRGGPYHFVYSKIMCWTALDRGITIAGRYGFPADVDRWTRHRDRIRREVLEKGWSKGKKASQKIEQKLLVTRKHLLNPGDPPGKPDSTDIIKDLKHLMNTLRGAYFRTAEGRIAYEEMADSRVYREYVQCSLYLNRFELSSLKTRNEQLAFWINLFNVLVIHGVIASGIRNSVKEMSRFFRRIRYRIDGLHFSPDDIEHGILRVNHRLPHSVFIPFGSGDPRRRFVIEAVDPRIHFALVCASSSCPPIDIYTAENLDQDLTISGKTFLNAGGIQVDREQQKVRLSRVFKWYGEDFGSTDAERLRFIAPYLYNEEDRRFLNEKADSVNIEYQPYDWRLNRT